MPSARRRSDPVVWGLAALVVWALALRVWFATPELHSGRYWDERYGLENVEAHLRHGQWLPANAYHPTLSYLPQLAVLGAAHGLARAAEDPAFAVLAPRFGFTPLGYLLARLVQTVFGALSIVWLYRVGRRLFDPPTALLAAAAMAVVPWHLRQSVIFKPDVLMLWLLLVAFEAALAAYERPRPAGFARAGLAVGLTAAAKFNGAAAALPLAIGWIAGPGRRRGLAGLALAGAITVAVFLALDPHLLLRPELLAADFGHTLRDYAAKGAEAAASRADVALHAVRSLLGVSFHGPVVGAVGLAGLLWMAVAAARAEPERRRRLAMAAGFPLGYVALYLAVTNNPSEHNWLPIVPFTSLGAAVLAVAAGRAATARLPAGARRWLLPAAALAAVLPLAAGATAYAYRVAVPSTWDLADRLVLRALGEDAGRRLVWQDGLDRYRVARRASRRRKPVLVSPRLARDAGFDPRGMDARLELTADGSPPAAALDGAEVRSLAARPFVAHGPPMRLVFHPWRLTGATPRLPAGGDGAFRVPPGDAGHWLTFEILALTPERPVAGLAAEWNGRRLPLFWGGTRGRRRVRWVTPRVPAAAAATALRVVGDPPPTVLRVDLVRWLPPEDGPPPG